MKQALPWNVTGIPPEARDVARSAALREGLSVGDWLTRRIIAESARGGPIAPEPASAPQLSHRHDRDEEARRDRDDLVVRLARAESEADGAFRRIDEALRNLSRRMESSERSQNEAQRTMSSAATDINAASRDQAQAFQHLAERIDTVERGADSSALRDAVRGLHQGLSRLADQIAKTANESSGQIGALAKNMDTIAGKVVSARGETARLEKVVEDRFHALGDRLKHADRIEQFVEERLSTFAERLKRSEERIDADDRIEQTVASLQTQMQSSEERVQDEIARQLASIERSIGGVSSRLEETERRQDDNGVPAALQALTQRLDRAERRKESDEGLQETLRGFSQRFDAAERKTAEVLDQIKSSLDESTKRIEAIEAAATAAKAKTAAMYDPGFSQGVSNFDLPPFPEAPPFVAPEILPRESAQPAPPPDMFATQPEPAPSAATQDYLAQARRAAQAASHPHAGGHGRAATGGGYQGQNANVVDLEERKKTRRVSRPVAAAVLVLLALSAGLFVTRTFGPSNNIASFAPGEQVALNTAPPSAITPPFPDTNSLPPAEAPAFQPQFPAPTFVPPPRPPSASGTRVASAPPPATATPLTQFPPPRAAAPLTQFPPPAPVGAGAPAGAAALAAATAQQRPPQAGGAPQDRLMAKAGAGDHKAELLLGLKYADGDGLAVNDAEAARWLEKAATAGEPVAQYRLGTLYEKGRGVALDAKQATRWYTEAARRGNRKAMHNLAVAYADGAGVEKSFPEAARWFRAAADLGLPDSQFNLAVLYERGLGVAVSLAEAYKWYSIAATGGDAESKARVEALATQIQPAEKTAADRNATAFRGQTVNLAANDPPPLAQVVQ